MKQILVVFLLYSSTLALPLQDIIAKEENGANFVTERITEDGEHETKASFQGVHAVQVATPQYGTSGLFWRELAHAHTLLWAVFSGRDSLVDCGIIQGGSQSKSSLKRVERFQRRWAESTHGRTTARSC